MITIIYNPENDTITVEKPDEGKAYYFDRNQLELLRADVGSLADNVIAIAGWGG